MARISLYRKRYMKEDLRKWINSQKKELGITDAQLGSKMGITGQAFGKRLRDIDFKGDQLIILFEELQASDSDILKFMKV